MAETWQVLRSVVKFCESKRGGHVIQWPIRNIKTQLFILGNLKGKTLFQVWGFIFIRIIFSFVKPIEFFLDFKTSFKIQIFSKLKGFF